MSKMPKTFCARSIGKETVVSCHVPCACPSLTSYLVSLPGPVVKGGRSVGRFSQNLGQSVSQQVVWNHGVKVHHHIRLMEMNKRGKKRSLAPRIKNVHSLFRLARSVDLVISMITPLRNHHRYRKWNVLHFTVVSETQSISVDEPYAPACVSLRTSNELPLSVLGFVTFILSLYDNSRRINALVILRLVRID